jgi:hypothetical protein
MWLCRLDLLSFLPRCPPYLRKGGSVYCQVWYDELHDSCASVDDLVDGVEILVEDLVHGEHVDAVLFKDCAHGFVAADLAPVIWVL